MSKSKIYIGIGSRKTPKPICEIMSQLGEKLANKGAVLRSGAAPGADKAFELGCDNQRGYKDIFKVDSWHFRDSTVTDIGMAVYRQSDLQKAESIASQYHPNWNNLRPYDKKLHTRNCFQVLGIDLDAPADFLICWTPDKAKKQTTIKTGGTGQAIRVAVAYGINVYNLSDKNDLEFVLKWLKKE